MLTIAINHIYGPVKILGYSGWPIPTPTYFGFSSAAEIFVILSGYMVGLAYSRTASYITKLLSRAVKIYAANFIVLLLALPGLLCAPYSLLKEIRFNTESSSPSTLLNALLLSSTINLFDVLQLYVILLILSVLAVWLLRKNVFLLLVASVTIYVTSQYLSMESSSIDEPGFSLSDWQILFFLPMCAGYKKLHSNFFNLYCSNKFVIVATLSVLIVSALLIRGGHLVGIYLNIPSKFHLSPLRILHASAVLVMYGWIAIFLQSPGMQVLRDGLMLLGRGTLICFCVSILATYYGVIYIFQPLGGMEGYIATVSFVLVCISIASSLLYLKTRLP